MRKQVTDVRTRSVMMLTSMYVTGQGLSHGVLRTQMAAAADTIHGAGTWDNPTGRRAVIHFRFATNNAANGIAARVYVVDQQATATVVQANVPITQAKRAIAMNGTLTGPALTVEQLEAYAQAGMAREILIHENLTVSLRLSSSKDMSSFSEDCLPATTERFLCPCMRKVVLILGCPRSAERTQL